MGQNRFLSIEIWVRADSPKDNEFFLGGQNQFWQTRFGLDQWAAAPTLKQLECLLCLSAQYNHFGDFDYNIGQFVTLRYD